MAEGCSHLSAISEVKPPTRRECEECIKVGDSWVAKKAKSSANHRTKKAEHHRSQH